MMLALMYGWHIIQIDFMLAYPQAPVKCPLYMKIPKGFQIPNGNRNTDVLRILRNLYGQKQAGRVWNQHLHQRLLELGWIHSTADDCVYYQGNTVFVVYVDDGILISPSMDNIRNIQYTLKSIWIVFSLVGTKGLGLSPNPSREC
jgi:Reverse transcriptase (RNA-dependent DNA polymerase)